MAPASSPDCLDCAANPAAASDGRCRYMSQYRPCACAEQRIRFRIDHPTPCTMAILLEYACRKRMGATTVQRPQEGSVPAAASAGRCRYMSQYMPCACAENHTTFKGHPCHLFIPHMPLGIFYRRVLHACQSMKMQNRLPGAEETCPGTGPAPAPSMHCYFSQQRFHVCLNQALLLNVKEPTVTSVNRGCTFCFETFQSRLLSTLKGGCTEKPKISGGNDSQGFEGVCPKKGTSQGQNLAVTVLVRARI